MPELMHNEASLILSEWTEMCQESINPEMANRLRAIAETNQQHVVAYICWGVARWLSKDYAGALVELERAISLDPLGWDAYFWRGVAHASLSQNEDTKVAIEKSLELGLPPVLLTPLRWLEQDRPDFYIKYVVPLLARSPIKVTDNQSSQFQTRVPGIITHAAPPKNDKASSQKDE